MPIAWLAGGGGIIAIAIAASAITAMTGINIFLLFILPPLFYFLSLWNKSEKSVFFLHHWPAGKICLLFAPRMSCLPVLFHKQL